MRAYAINVFAVPSKRLGISFTELSSSTIAQKIKKLNIYGLEHVKQDKDFTGMQSV